MADDSGPSDDALSEPLSWLFGARVQRVDSPSEGLFVLTLYDRGNKPSLLLSVHSQRTGVGIVDQRPTGLPASAFVRRLRIAIENAQLSSASWLPAQQPTALLLRFVRKELTTLIVADFHPQQPNLFLLDPEQYIVGAADERAKRARFPDRHATYTPPARAKLRVPITLLDWANEGAALAKGGPEAARDALRQEARNKAKANLKRVERRIAAVEGDLARARTAPLLRHEANLLLCNLRDVPSGASSISLHDPADDSAAPLTIALDPALSAQQNAERRFVRARRLERGIAIAEQRLAEAQTEAQRLRDFLAGLAETSNEQLAVEAQTLRLALPAAGEPPRRKQPTTRIPYRTFEGTDGALILVGKGAADNDTLTLTVARPHDLWLHARGIQGAHVILPKERNVEPTPELLIDAAHLAAHFSDARGEAVTEIQHTERRYLRKPKGSAPGNVRVDRERVLLLRIEPERLKRLLGSERLNP